MIKKDIKYARGKNPNSHIRSDEVKLKTSLTLKEKHKNKKWGFAEKDFVPWNKGLKGFMKGIPRHSYNDDFREKIKNWSKDYHKTHKVWNKDLLKDDDIRLMNISISMENKNPMFIIDNRKKVSMTAQGVSEKEWNGFLIYKNNRTNEHLLFREFILERDNHTCICEKNGNEIHHIDYDNFNDIFENVITLCKSCHSKTNWNREYWKKFLINYLIQKYQKEVVI